MSLPSQCKAAGYRVSRNFDSLRTQGGSYLGHLYLVCLGSGVNQGLAKDSATNGTTRLRLRLNGAPHAGLAGVITARVLYSGSEVFVHLNARANVRARLPGVERIRQNTE